MGAITPLGNDVETLWNNLVNGVCGIDYITKIDTTDLPVKIAAEVKDFDPIQHGVDSSFARRNDLFSIYALAASIEAMKGNENCFEPERLGVYVGSGEGGFDTILKEVVK